MTPDPYDFEPEDALRAAVALVWVVIVLAVAVLAGAAWAVLS